MGEMMILGLMEQADRIGASILEAQQELAARAQQLAGLHAGIEKASVELAGERVALRSPCNETSSPSWSRFACPGATDQSKATSTGSKCSSARCPIRAGFDVLRLRVLHAN